MRFTSFPLFLSRYLLSSPSVHLFLSLDTEVGVSRFFESFLIGNLFLRPEAAEGVSRVRDGCVARVSLNARAYA